MSSEIQLTSPSGYLLSSKMKYGSSLTSLFELNEILYFTLGHNFLFLDYIYFIVSDTVRGSISLK